ncbi:MAG: hypothetical protein JXQ65_07325 [Candidatus Marinimicrobia bacterium]|nr:hypothetical protein [Candidatus Neomarinimicrobiota bacterium]
MTQIRQNKEEKIIKLFDESYSATGIPPVLSSTNVFTSCVSEINFELGDFNIVVIEPDEYIDAEEAWFEEPEWLQGELEADEDIKNGRYFEFENPEEVISFLDAASK